MPLLSSFPHRAFRLPRPHPPLSLLSQSLVFLFSLRLSPTSRPIYRIYPSMRSHSLYPHAPAFFLPSSHDSRRLLPLPLRPAVLPLYSHLRSIFRIRPLLAGVSSPRPPPPELCQPSAGFRFPLTVSLPALLFTFYPLILRGTSLCRHLSCPVSFTWNVPWNRGLSQFIYNFGVF